MYVNFNKHPNVLLRWCCVHCELHTHTHTHTQTWVPHSKSHIYHGILIYNSWNWM